MLDVVLDIAIVCAVRDLRERDARDDLAVRDARRRVFLHDRLGVRLLRAQRVGLLPVHRHGCDRRVQVVVRHDADDGRVILEDVADERLLAYWMTIAMP